MAKKTNTVGVLRTRKDGNGCSICRASEENVGKKRCCHVLDDASMTVKKINHTNFVNIKGSMNGESADFSIAATEEKIRNYISNLSDGLSNKEKKSILDALRQQ